MFLCPEGEEQHNTTHPHYTPPTPPLPPPPRRYQTQFALFTMPACPMAKVQFLFFFFFLALMGTKSPLPTLPPLPHNKSISPQRLILAVTDIQCGCTFRYQSRNLAAKGESETRDSKRFPPLQPPPPTPEVSLGHLGNKFFLSTHVRTKTGTGYSCLG